MITEVYINNTLVDLEDEETVVASYGNVSFGELTKRKGVKSNTPTLPFSTTNKSVYESCEVQGSYSLMPYRKATFRVDIDGTTVFEGWCVLEESSKGYMLQSFTGASDFYNTINGRKLSSLDLSEFNHIWNELNIKNSWTNTKGYIYAHVDYGKAWPTDVLNQSLVPPDYLLPQIFFHTVIKQIATDAGYTLMGDVLTNPRFLKHLILANKFPLTINYGGNFVLSDLLTDITQSKVWLDFANLYGLQFDIDELAKTIRCNYIDDILFNDPEDWSNKIDKSEKQAPTKYRFDTFGQKTILKYKTEDIGFETAWQGFEKEVLIDDTNLKEEATLYESQFFLIQEVDTLLFPNSPPTARTFPTKPGKTFRGMWRDDVNYSGAAENQYVWYNGSYWVATADSLNKVPPLEADFWKGVKEVDIFDIKSRLMYGVLSTNPGSSVTVAFDTPVVVTKYVDNTGMSWPEIYQAHYRVFNRIIDRTKILKPLVKLSYADINQIDFTRAKKIDNELYFLEEIKQFKLNQRDSTLVDLVRI